jgi:aspartyl protease family protein
MDDNQYVRAGRVMFVFVWLIVFAGLFLFFYYQGNGNSRIIMANQHECIVTGDAQGHYFIKGSINEYPVAFLIDTGASVVAIPKTIAEKLQLTGGYPLTLSTANGEITGFLTRVDKLHFGAFTIYDVKAVIIPDNDDNTVLLGMNVLARFNMTQQNKRLILKNIE